MKIKSLHIKNFKSIVDLTINEPNNFTVFVGPNGSGKSNIFEALEFLITQIITKNAIRLFGGELIIKNRNHQLEDICIEIYDEDKVIDLNEPELLVPNNSVQRFARDILTEISLFVNSFTAKAIIFSRIFIKNKDKQKINYPDSLNLNFSCDNLEKVLERLLKNEEKRAEISEWLALFIPEFDRIEVHKSEYSSNENLLIYQKHYDRPFGKDLISDGTYNIIALLVAVYQSDEPQFLCIEEPENGLNPYVIRKLVDLFRQVYKDKGHYIWLNTHSQTLVECLEPEEIIVVDKINGETKIKQIKGMNLHGLDMAEVWLSGALGGGTPW